ncbi:hypothetical protein B0T14DRAFT_246680 [Immersiella caudata]|uniref:Uncharacterized protein n=1 Tax=Immersiella caudata TaxID=314043 RepID=A0AA39WJ83_9PEZI|nr:hypothetical protein B0T14DRAFT_246680 [Immersiella caudata]
MLSTATAMEEDAETVGLAESPAIGKEKVHRNKRERRQFGKQATFTESLESLPVQLRRQLWLSKCDRENAQSLAPDATSSDLSSPKSAGKPAVSGSGCDNSPPESLPLELSVDSPSPPGEDQESAADDPFRDALQVPGCSPMVWVYPHGTSLIHPNFHDRYRELVNIFRINAEDHLRLRDKVHYIDYALRICGTSPTESHPSILVFCRQSEFKTLRTILTSKELKYQYHPHQPSAKFPKLPWSSRAPAAVEGKPFFNLYFWRQQRPRTLLAREEEAHIIRNTRSRPGLPLPGEPTLMVQRLTLCGLTVWHRAGYLLSTLGCVITIGDMSCAITTAHAWQSSRVPKDKEPASVSDSDTDSTDCSQSDGDGAFDNVQYDSPTEDDDESFSEGDSPWIAHSAKESPVGSDHKHLSSVMFNTPDELYENNASDFDWAIVKLEDPRDHLPNAFYDPDLSALTFISGVADCPPAYETPVLVISDQIRPRKGVLHPVITMLGGVNGRAGSPVWTMIMDENNG